MKVGVLIIGSLYWDPSHIRCRWREARLDCTGERKVRVPIRYGKIAKTRGNTYTMVFAMSCTEDSKLGTAIVVPARAACCEPAHLVEEAELLWAGERNLESVCGFYANWGKVCVLENPNGTISAPVLDAWTSRVKSAGKEYSSLPTATGEGAVLDPSGGRALFQWPTDDDTKQPLAGFDLLLMTATKPDFLSSQYPTPKDIAKAWRDDKFRNVNYFFNNYHYGIKTFQDAEIIAALCEAPPNTRLQRTALKRGR